MRIVAAFLGLATLCSAQWVMTSSTNPAVRAIAPDVHAIRSDDGYFYVDSAGLSLHSFGQIEANQYDAPLGPRALSFRIPKHPKSAVEHISTPLGIVGVFVTGVPIYNPIGTFSYQDRNIWHQDAVAATFKASSLLTALTTDTGRHSPIIGFALDGYPIYGPFGWDTADRVHRMQSSYRPRNITARTKLPDGTLLTPAQEGPAVTADFPPGTFAEDYEYAEGSGDLDEFNGRFAKTPEYPQGTYAYFLTSTWPYLIGPRYYGDPQLDGPARVQVKHSDKIDLWTDRTQIKPNEQVRLTLVFHDSRGGTIRFLEKVHEQAVHMIVVSKDLAGFGHIHPEPVPGDGFSVTHAFPHAGEYWIYADYTAPGEGPSIARFALTVEGESRPDIPLIPDTEFTKTVKGIRIALTAPRELKANRDLALSFTLSSAENGQPVADLDPWPGAWGHIMIVSEDGKEFIHAHPLEPNSMGSIHNHVIAGSSPCTIRTINGFRSPGVYKVWLQFQRHGELITVPWVVRVSEPDRSGSEGSELPGDVIYVSVNSKGFEPARLEIPARREIHIAFSRSDAQNCASEVVFPELKIRKPLAPGQTVVVDLPAQSASEMHFSCGMGMFRGALVIR